MDDGGVGYENIFDIINILRVFGVSKINMFFFG